MPSRKTCVLTALALLTSVIALASGAARADPAPFDLAGPTLEVEVTRGHQTLPIGEVPNLAPGDRLAVKADLPATQSAPYLMVVAFLRGSTNPPPSRWFHSCKTWTRRRCASQGIEVRIPKGAQQVLVFLAPKTGGDLRTLVGAVRGRPGAFVRASQDLNQAMLDRSRLERYLASIHSLSGEDPSKLKAAAPLLGRSLAIQVDRSCLLKIPELQAPCLMQGRDSLILDDGHSTSIVEALTSGPATDLAMEASYTPELRYGYFSPYVASVLDIARIMASFATAQYQYIPALGAQQGGRIALRLNTPPSFHDPLSVLVTALPAIEQAQLPPLHAVDPKEIYCARKSTLVLPVEGAPLVFSTQYAHDMRLELTGVTGSGLALPAKADPERGGFVVDTAHLQGAKLGAAVRGSLQGFWGFSKYAGPQFQLMNARAGGWQLGSDAGDVLIVGRQDTVHLRAGSISCIDSVMLKDPAGKDLAVDWKAVKPGEVELKLPLKSVQPGSMTLLVKQYGASAPERVPLEAFSEPGRLDGFTLHAGDATGTLRGTRLDEVASLEMDGIEFDPGSLTTARGTDALAMAAKSPTAAAVLVAGQRAAAQVRLKDGRVLRLAVTVGPPRPSVTLIGKSVQPAGAAPASHIELVDQDELPQNAVLVFSVRARSPAKLPQDFALEVATADNVFSTTLTLANGGITLENASVAVATLDPRKALGFSASGPLEVRAVVGGVAGDWQPLATLVRLPRLETLVCPRTSELACKLSGSDLYLVASISADPGFRHALDVPDGFPGDALPVPHPEHGELYVRLRDDPSVVNRAMLAVQALPPTPEELARAAARRAAAQAAASWFEPAADSAYPAALSGSVGGDHPAHAAAAHTAAAHTAGAHTAGAPALAKPSPVTPAAAGDPSGSGKDEPRG
ncbi:MAG: hypothetical protein ACREU3_02770 [Steroidobacteraceae bacterium]